MVEEGRPFGYEEGRRDGLHQAATYIRGEIEALRVLQRRTFDGHRDVLIRRLISMARQVETLK